MVISTEYLEMRARDWRYILRLLLLMVPIEPQKTIHIYNVFTKDKNFNRKQKISNCSVHIIRFNLINKVLIRHFQQN